MKSKERLLGLVNQIKKAKEESIKASSYSDGYLDCIKDILNDEDSDFNKILTIKHDGKVRNEVYSEILPILEKTLEEFDLSKKEATVTQQAVVTTESSVMHPSERARSFLERIGR
jgi:non-homologous end joining protein Ku